MPCPVFYHHHPRGHHMSLFNRARLGFLAAALTACGGGGGGDGIPKECESYCDLGCSKLGVCVSAPSGFAETCSQSCVSKLKEQQTATASSCVSASQVVMGADC